MAILGRVAFCLSLLLWCVHGCAIAPSNAGNEPFLAVAMTEAEPSVGHKKTLRWFFTQDPRTQGVEIPDGFRVVKLRIVGFPYFLSSRDGLLLSILLKAQFRNADDCSMKQMEVNELELELPRHAMSDGDEFTPTMNYLTLNLR